MNHDAELARLPPWTHRYVLLLLERRPMDVARHFGVVCALVYEARHIAAKRLGYDSEIVQAMPDWKRKGRPRSRPNPDADLADLPDGPFVQLLTTPGPDGHTHVARFNENGNGHTISGPHVHRVCELDVEAMAGHGHELTDQRA